MKKQIKSKAAFRCARVLRTKLDQPDGQYMLDNGCFMALLQLRFEYDSSAIRARVEHSMLQHATRFFVRSHASPMRAPYENRVEACHTVD